MNYPKKEVIGEITVRDGFQHEEKYISLEAKLWFSEQLVLAGFKHIEITNLGTPKAMPQFKDGDDLIKRIKTSKKIAHLIDSVTLTAVTIREKAIIRAIEDKKNGYVPDRILLMTPTSYSYHFKNAGMSYEDYWKLAEKYIKLCDDVGIKVNGSVSTIWGCPIEGPTDLNRAIEFTKRWLDIDKVLNIGKMVERIVGRKLRSESIRTGRVPKELKSN